MLAVGPLDKPEGAPSPSVGNEELAVWARRLAAGSVWDAPISEAQAGPRMTGGELIDRVQLLEHLSSAIAAEHARTATAFSDLSHGRTGTSEEDTARELRARVRSIGGQIALARKAAPASGRRIVELSEILVHDMPHTRRALAQGTLTEDRAFTLVGATRPLTREDRADVDRRLCAQPARIAHLGDRALEDAARRAVEDVDAGAAAECIRRAEADRHVSLRRLPDAMAKVTAILPVAGAMAVREALKAAAEAAKAAGDPRALGQLAADTLVERTTGLADAGRVPLRISLVMTDRTLLAGDAEPAVLPGYGTVPADFARELIDRALAGPDGHPGSVRPEGTAPLKSRERIWLERLYTAPGAGQLIAMDSKARLFPAAMARFLRLRDHTCRTPYCDAPTQHIDHVVPAAQGGPTTIENGQCLCALCNLTKESPGWRHTTTDPGPTREVQAPPVTRRITDGRARSRPQPQPRARHRTARHTVETRTPTGHTYESTPPGLPGSADP